MKTAEHDAGAILAASPCLLCGCLQHRPIFYESGIPILQCRHCRHVFSSFRANPHHDGFWGDEVLDGDHVYWSLARARMHEDFFKGFVAGRSGRLLDMGCGLGFFLKALSAYSNWEGFGCEISSAAVRYARERLNLANVVCRRLQEADFSPQFFDIVTLWDVIDHIPHPDPLLQRCHALLRTDGMCFIRTPNIFVQLLRARLTKRLRPGVAYLQVRDHAHHYSMSSIRQLLERNGFSRVEFVHLHPIHNPSSMDSPFRRGIRTALFEGVRAVAAVSNGRLNFDNLFVVARKA